MCFLCSYQGGDLRAALSGDLTGELRWYHRGQHIALDVARGLHYLHSHDVRDCAVFLDTTSSRNPSH